MSAAPNAAPAVWHELMEAAEARLGSAIEARWLVEEASGCGWAELLRGDQHVREIGLLRFEAMLARRLSGEPLQYVIGSWPFRGLDLMVDPRVLIPRPETEHMVEVALGEIDRLGGPAEAGEAQMVVVDLGTGSGAIALSIAGERARTVVHATDVSAGALEVAAANLAGLGGRAATRVRLYRGSWWTALPVELAGRVDLAVSNPPYISTPEMADLDPGVRNWEPKGALEAGPRGVEAIESILSGAPSWLRRGGAAVLEIAPHQAEDARSIAASRGFSEVFVVKDLTGRDRVLVARGAPGR